MKWRTPVARGSLLLMEALWVYALAVLVVTIGGGPEAPSLIGAGLIVILSYTISRLLQSSDLEVGVIRLWGMVISLLLFYAIIRVDLFGDWRLWDFTWADRFAGGVGDTLRGHTSAVFAVPLLWAVWMRGVSRGQDPLMFEAVVSSFATGVVVIVLIELLAQAVDAPAAIGYVAVPYMALGLIAISLAHAARSELEYGRSFSGGWLLAVGGAVLAMSLVAVLFVLVDLGTMRDGIAFAATWIGRGLFYVFYAFTYVIAFAVEAVVKALFWFLGVDRNNEPPRPVDQGEVGGNPDALDPGLPGWAWTIGRVIGGGTVVALAAAALYFTFVRYMKRPAADAMKESTYSDGRLGADLGNLLGSMLGRLRPNIHFGGEPDPVRRLYFEMLHEASNRGVERGAAQTPLELAPALDRTFMSDAPDAITAAFDDVRYGALTLPPNRVRSLREDWDATKRG